MEWLFLILDLNHTNTEVRVVNSIPSATECFCSDPDEGDDIRYVLVYPDEGDDIRHADSASNSN